MEHMKKILRFLIFWVLMLPVAVLAQYERPGSSGGQFLGISISPRGAAMGGAFISASDGADAVYYNPAAMVQVAHTAACFSYTKWFADINLTSAALVHNLGRIGAVGAIVNILLTDEMEVRTPLQPDGTGETFFAGDYRFGLSYARWLTDRVSFGGSLSYIYSTLYHDISAQAVSADVAVLYVTDFRDFKFGLKFEHFGSELKFINEAYPLPTNFQFGLSINAFETTNQTILVSLSAQKHNEGKPIGQMGAEWNFNRTLFLRGGYKLNSDVETFSFGAGVRWKIKQYIVSFDYSYSDYNLLNGAHRFGMAVNL